VTRCDLLSSCQDETYARLRARLHGLSDDEFFWQPVAECWTIYQDRSGQWAYHYAIPDPDPAPVTTIGWQLVHLGLCKLMYHEWAFGAAKLTFPEIPVPHTASDAIELLEHGQALLRNDLHSLSEAQLDEPRRTNWGDLWPAWRIFWAMLDHDAVHGGAIGHLRDVYRWQRAVGGGQPAA
jgi:hypothetical protein